MVIDLTEVVSDDLKNQGTSRTDNTLTMPCVTNGGARSRRVAVLGLGYVGLPTCIGLARGGHEVVGYDTSSKRIDAIRRYEVDILDRDLMDLRSAIAHHRVSFTTTPESLRSADAVIICVPTPVDDHHVPVLDAVASACATAVGQARTGQTIILTSTSFAGTTRRYLIEPLEAAGFRVGTDVHVAFAPERIDPGNSRFPQETVPRVVGGATPLCARMAKGFLEAVAPSVHIVASPEDAELTKLFENTFRAVNIALANELAEICESLGINPVDVIDAAATKPYGFMPFYPGPGVGGHCIPVDPHYLLWHTHSIGVSAPVIEQAMEEIAHRPQRMIERVAEVLNDDGIALRGARVLVVGVAYKPGTCDLRGSPALEIISRLAGRGACVSVHDPVALNATTCGNLVLDQPEPSLDRYDLVVLHTQHPGVDYSWLTKARRVLDLTFRGIGLPQQPGAVEAVESVELVGTAGVTTTASTVTVPLPRHLQSSGGPSCR